MILSFLTNCYETYGYLVTNSWIRSTTLFATFRSFRTSCTLFCIPIRGGTTSCRSIISSYNFTMVSFISPDSSCMVDCHSNVLKLWEDSRWFSTMRCFTCYFTATNSFLNRAFPFKKYFELSYATVAK